MFFKRFRGTVIPKQPLTGSWTNKVQSRNEDPGTSIHTETLRRSDHRDSSKVLSGKCLISGRPEAIHLSSVHLEAIL